VTRLSELLPVLGDVQLIGPGDQAVRGVEYWLGEVGPGDLYVAVPGAGPFGLDRIAAAIAAGARTILAQRLDGRPAKGVSYVLVADPVKAMGRLAHALHGLPSQRMRVVGVTGTNGKTTTATLLHRLLRGLGRPAGLLSNIGDYVNDAASEPRYTTGPATFQAPMMARMARAGCQYCAMEVSSQGIAEDRLEGVAFDGAIFTNLTRDHLDYHGTMEAYAAAKKHWFDQLPAEAFALTNLDDPRGEWMTRDTRARRVSYGMGQGADLRFRIADETFSGLTLEIDGRTLRARLLGAFNACNIAAVYAAACELGQDPAEAAEVLATLGPVEGRMQPVRAADGRLAIVDYAHTPDAVEKVLRHLQAARPMGGRIITVIGCGGGGDVGRRPIMAAAAAALSDRLILTSDNPRLEDPERIVADMAGGLDREALARTETIMDRREAIEAACALARPDDILLIAGKGCERYQDIGGVRRPFDDTEVARAALGL
jgi:UDP-N-acetylmuramoyl-L-alanyl-D-glutamate--2,6-diaminopimelate ligase